MAWILGTTDKASTEKAVHDNPFYSDVDIVWEEGNWTDKCRTVHHYNAKVFRGTQFLGYIYGDGSYAFTPPEGDLPCDIWKSTPQMLAPPLLIGGIVIIGAFLLLFNNSK